MKRAILIFMFLNIGCGVKGDPRPPLTPTEIGRGRPGFKGALNAQDLQKMQQDDQDEEDTIKKKKPEDRK
ncbi:MAG: hypothetical protein CL677_07350 [Bdellovibrionaceae bacterium]|nr:hypothetical protein [Pseudobdellovibrionaceae bacterium]|tara:strand:- start:213 stop:422 length:210 start_codon:yes stop_codon:yes gene_type:complete